MSEEIKNISYIGFDDSCWVEMICSCGQKFKEWCGSSGRIFKCPKCGQKYKYEVYVKVLKINGEKEK
jgi:hypothetical protein